MSEDVVLRLLASALPQLEASFRDLPPSPAPIAAMDAMAAVMNQVAERMADNFPYFHPLYAGQMLKPPHPLARAAYALAMVINPNNHALDGGRASSRMEVEAVRAIAGMFGWADYLGHLTSGGTFANLEALWVAGQLAPGKRVVASEQAHYTHGRISAVLGLPFSAVSAGNDGRMELAALESALQKGDVGTVVVTLGTTATGAVDPLHEVLALRSKIPFRVHVDAAYGGYFTLVSNLGENAARAFACLAQADSIVVDPHKHGLQPYGCGCILFREPAVGRFYKHDSPYTYFSSEDLHLGEISLECSRAGASAVALWATQQLLPLIKTVNLQADCVRVARRRCLCTKGFPRMTAGFLPFRRTRHPGLGGARRYRRCIVPVGAANLCCRRPREPSSRAGPVTQQILPCRLVDGPAPAPDRYLPPFRTHEARPSGVAADDLEQTEPRDR